MAQPKVELQTELTCPECGHHEREEMPTDFCQARYECRACHVILSPLERDCCVFCSYATVPCPPVQEHGKCC